MEELIKEKRNLNWFEKFLWQTSTQYHIERNHEENSYKLCFQGFHNFDSEKGYTLTYVAKFYKSKQNVEIYSYNGEDFDLFVKGLSMLKYWIDSASPEERFEDETRSAYKHKNFKTKHGEDLYLNIATFSITKEQYPCLYTLGDRYEYLQKYFTDKEIDRYTRKFGINLSEYEKRRCLCLLKNLQTN